MRSSAYRPRTSPWAEKSSLKESRPVIARWAIALVLLSSIIWLSSFAIGYEAALTILTVGSLLITIIGLRSPALGLLGMGMMATLDPVSRNFELLGGLWRYNTYNYLLLLVISLNIIFILRLNDIHTRLIQLFLIVISLQLLISPDITSGVLDVINIVAIFGLVVFFARGIREPGAYYWLGLVAGFLGAFGGLAYILQIESLPNVNPNGWSLVPLTSLFAISLGFPLAKDFRFGRLTLSTLAVVNFAWIFLSGSRGTILTGLACLFLLVMLTRSFTLTSSILVVGLLFISAASTIFIDQETYTIDRIVKSFDTSYTLEQRTSGRSEIAEIGLTVFLDNPFGVGTGGFQEEATNYEYFEGRSRPAHSAWIKTLAENGIIGFLLLFAYVISFAWVGLHKNNRVLLLIGLLVTIAFTVGFISKELQGKNLWFLAAGATVLLHKENIVQYLETNFHRRLRGKYGRQHYPIPKINYDDSEE
jgi:hypothetical protein